ncbi:APC family permease [Nocardia sp. JMUB6875]|uniref:APC family permease n=1 Tax=Nocardia sp. JMUB6875 TaxID=3158170 RepID=UPI0032E55F0E
MEIPTANRKGLSLFALIMIGIGSIFGSGWLFGAGQAAQVAGPAAIIAWVIGAVFIGLIAMSYAEVGAAYPFPGSMARFGSISHGPVLGFITGWAVWIAVAALIPIESIASTQYMSSWSFSWAQGLMKDGSLTMAGMGMAFVLTVVLWLCCYWSVGLLAKVNNLLTAVKFGIPVLAVVALIASGFHTENFHGYGGFAPNGWSAVLTAVSTCGVVFAFNGFQAVVNLGGAAKNPGKAIPAALVGALSIGLVIYMLLQVAFIGAVPPEQLAEHGWVGINFNSPFVDIAKLLMLGWLVIMLQFGAFISPSGANIANVASASYMVQNLAQTGFFPKKLAESHPKYGTARPAMWLNLAFSLILLLTVGHSWHALAGIVSAAMVISYLIGPIAVGVFRKTKPELPRPFRLPAANVITPLAFTLAACALYWTHWPNTGRIVFITLLSVPVAVAVLWKRGERTIAQQLAPAWWMIAFLIFMATVSALGSPDFGGTGLIPGGIDIALVAAAALATYYWAVRAGVKAHESGLPGPDPVLDAEPEQENEIVPLDDIIGTERDRDLQHA